jgi:hypothetical protein
MLKRLELTYILYFRTLISIENEKHLQIYYRSDNSKRNNVYMCIKPRGLSGIRRKHRTKKRENLIQKKPDKFIVGFFSPFRTYSPPPLFLD